VKQGVPLKLITVTQAKRGTFAVYEASYRTFGKIAVI
jgi:hypothetical protein